jgi:excisionase family DNA binding protein
MGEIILSGITVDELTKAISDTFVKCLKEYSVIVKPGSEIVYLSRKEAAVKLKVTLKTLMDYTMQGKVKGYRIGRRVLYKNHEIDEALKQIRV